MKKKLIVIVGATASGKSKLALSLAKEYQGYLISADSRQVYQEMTIMTGKDKGEWLKQNSKKIYLVQGVPEYLVDIIKPDKEFSLANYQKKVFKLIKETEGLPFLVGGTGLYVAAVVDNYDLPKVKPNLKLRLKLEKELQEKGLDYLVNLLVNKDKTAKDYVNLQNPRRVIRALEVVLTSKKPFFAQKRKNPPRFDCLLLGLDIDREKLYKKINSRVDKMLTAGGLDEAFHIYQHYGHNLPAASAIGYRQLFAYFDGKIAKQEAIEKLKQDTRHYAKRQLTWFNKDKRIIWVRNFLQAKKYIDKFLDK